MGLKERVKNFWTMLKQFVARAGVILLKIALYPLRLLIQLSLKIWKVAENMKNGNRILGSFVFMLTLWLIALSTRNMGGEYWNWGGFFFLMSFLWLFISIGIVREEETGAVSFLGRFVSNESSGPVLVPFPLFRLITEKKTVEQIEVPDEPEKVWKGDDDKIPAGMTPPVRIIHAEFISALYFDPSDPDAAEPTLRYEDLTKEEKEKVRSDPLHTRLVTEVSTIVRIRINDLVAFKSMTRSMENAKKQIVDTVVTALQDIMARLTPAHAAENKRRISNIIRKKVEILCGELKKDGESDQEREDRAWGIAIEDVDIKLIDLRKRVNESIAEANAALTLKKKKVTDAEGDKAARVLKAEADSKAIELEGEAEAIAILAKAKAKADGVKALATEIASGEGAEAARLQTMSEVAGKAEFMVLPTDSIMGAGMGIAEALKKRTPKP